VGHPGRIHRTEVGRRTADKFWGGIIGAFLAALFGGLVTGYLLPAPGIPSENPPGIQEALWAIPGSVTALALSYAYGARKIHLQEAASSSLAT